MKISKEQLAEMFLLQKKMNDDTNGKSWIVGFTDKGREVNWPRCIYGEAFEMLDSYPWKHWKDISGKADIGNAQVELVDIWHFLMSYGLHVQYMIDHEVILNDLLESNKEFSQDHFDKSFEKSISKNLTQRSLDCFNKGHEENLSKDYDVKSFFKKVDELVFLSSKAAMEEHEDKTVASFAKRLFLYESMLTIMGSISKEDLSFNAPALYLGKNALNKIRQDNGYKEGSYIKMWNDLEDNVCMMEILENIPEDEISFSKIYDELDLKYKSL